MSVHGGPADWWTEGTDAGRKHIATKGIVQNGLVLNLDAGVSDSYPGSGTTWTDLSGNGNNGTLTNGPTYSNANGGIIVFDGVNDFSSQPYSSLLNLGTQLTITSFIKPNNVSGNNPVIFSTLDVTATNTYTEGYGFFLSNVSEYGLNANTLRFQFGQNNWAWNFYSSNGLIINDNNWHFVSLTVSGLNTSTPTIVFYIDNNSVIGTFWNAASKSAIRYSNNTNSCRIGSIYYATRTNYSGPFYGNLNMSNCQIYNRALTVQEIRQNFNAYRNRFGL